MRNVEIFENVWFSLFELNLNSVLDQFFELALLKFEKIFVNIRLNSFVLWDRIAPKNDRELFFKISANKYRYGMNIIIE